MNVTSSFLTIAVPCAVPHDCFAFHVTQLSCISCHTAGLHFMSHSCPSFQVTQLSWCGMYTSTCRAVVTHHQVSASVVWSVAHILLGFRRGQHLVPSSRSVMSACLNTQIEAQPANHQFQCTRTQRTAALSEVELVKFTCIRDFLYPGTFWAGIGEGVHLTR